MTQYPISPSIQPVLGQEADLFRQMTELQNRRSAIQKLAREQSTERFYRANELRQMGGNRNAGYAATHFGGGSVEPSIDPATGSWREVQDRGYGIIDAPLGSERRDSAGFAAMSMAGRNPVGYAADGTAIYGGNIIRTPPLKAERSEGAEGNEKLAAYIKQLQDENKMLKTKKPDKPKKDEDQAYMDWLNSGDADFIDDYVPEFAEN